MTRSLSPRVLPRANAVRRGSVAPSRPACLLLALLLGLAFANSAGAQDEFGPEVEDPLEVVSDDMDMEATWSDVEEIRVTGQASSNVLTSATDSATRFDSDLVDAVGANDLSDLAKFTPNLEIRTMGATSPTFFIRGVGLSDFNANAGGAIAIYQDGVAMNAPALQLGQLLSLIHI